MRVWILPLLAFILCLSQASGQVRPLVVIGCFDGQPYPPEFCPNYSQAILDLASDALGAEYGPEIEVRTIGDWFFFLDVITMPNVIGGFISLREGQFRLSKMRQEEFVAAFEKGLGLVGLNYVGHNSSMGRVAHEVFPLNGTRTAPGRVHRNEIVTSRHTHVRLLEHPATSGVPDTIEIPDSSLVYNFPIPDQGWWTPKEGKMTVLYACTTASAGAEVPSMVLYEREGGRSVTFAGFRHTDAPHLYQRDVGWFNHSLGMPEVRQLLAAALVYALEPYATADPLKARMEESRAFVDEKLHVLQAEVEAAERSVARQRNQSMLLTFVVIGLASVAGAGIVCFGFVRE